MNGTRVTSHEGTWLGKKGVSTNYHLTDAEHGLRVNVFQLEGVSTTKVTLIKGNGREEGFVTFTDRSLRNPTEEKLQECISDLIQIGKSLK